ncbi:MAG: pyruvate kinase [Acidimicrobiaceae bacterium]|nr:pyruvate kinase [Acidimicrobiaceae bacterium]MDQ1417180.1 pyruvate kinase [Acidimicrobiaceae bacterium]MDQ1441643.1 pyruvate kinase [Acidimicrobiaceae bacterium]
MARASPARRTKIVATIGPASADPALLVQMIHAGMDMARLGLAHEPVEASIAKMRLIRGAAEVCGRHIGVLADLPGPKVRAGSFPAEGVALSEGAQVGLVPEGGSSGPTVIGIDYPRLLQDIEPGDLIALGDGGVTLLVEAVEPSGAVARVRSGGVLRGRPGVNLPPEKFSIPTPTPEDMRLLDAVTEAGVDAVAISFVRTSADVRAVRNAVGPDGPMLVAKIETPAAVDDLDAIIEASDGVMVARGDLGVRIPLERVPHIQKRIIRSGVSRALPVITATQMLESMIQAPTPTRAEVSDVANAVLDGSSALMLSAETAVGHDPVAAVAWMARIALAAEQEFDYYAWGSELGRRHGASGEAPNATRIVSAITAAAWRAAYDADASAIICATRSGTTARSISRFRPPVPVVAVTPSLRTARQLSVAWGIQSVLDQERSSIDDIVWFSVKAAVEAGACRPGDIVVVLVGFPDELEPATDVLRLVRVH